MSSLKSNFFRGGESKFYDQLEFHFGLDELVPGPVEELRFPAFNGINHNATINQPGKVRRAYSFNGVDSYVDIPVRLLDDPGVGNPFNMTVKFWYKHPTGNLESNIPIFGDQTVDSYRGAAITLRTNDIVFRYGNGSTLNPNGRKSFIAPTNLLQNTDWNCVWVEFVDIDTINCWVNNQPIVVNYSSGNATSVAWNFATYFLMRKNHNGTIHAPGGLSNITGWKKLWIPNERTEAFNLENSGQILF